MGGTSSKEQAEYCKFTKIQFTYLLSIIQDCHSVMQFYASALLLQKIPIKFTEYKVYSDDSEEFFNGKRNTPSGSGMNDYDTYLYVKNFQKMYEGLESEIDRKQALETAFNATYDNLTRAIQDLSDSCLSQ